MQTEIAVQLLIYGRLGSDEFPDWISHRVRILDVSAWINLHHKGFIEVMAIGHPILLDALELACSIGPYSVTVDSITMTPISEPLELQAFRKLS